MEINYWILLNLIKNIYILLYKFHKINKTLVGKVLMIIIGRHKDILNI